MDAHALRVFAGRQAPPPFLKGPTNSFFLVSTEIAGCPCRLGGADLPRDVAELRVPIGVLAAFARFDVPLQAVAETVQQLGDHGVAHGVAERLQRDATANVRVLRQVQRSGESGSPGAVGSTSASRSRSNVGLVRRRSLAPPAGLPDPVRRQGGVGGIQLRQPAADRGRREAGRAGDHGDAAVTQGARLGRRPQPPDRSVNTARSAACFARSVATGTPSPCYGASEIASHFK